MAAERMNHMSATVNETALAIVMTSGEAFPSNETLARVTVT